MYIIILCVCLLTLKLVQPVATVLTASSLATAMGGQSVTPSLELASVLLVTMVMGVGKVHATFIQYLCTCPIALCCNFQNVSMATLDKTANKGRCTLCVWVCV